MSESGLQLALNYLDSSVTMVSVVVSTDMAMNQIVSMSMNTETC